MHSNDKNCFIIIFRYFRKDGGKICGNGAHFPSVPVKCLADLRNGVNGQRYSSIYEDQSPKIVEDIERSDGKKSA